MSDLVHMDDSGARMVYGDGAMREPATGKGRFDLISPFALDRLAHWYEAGAKKYADRNWEKGMPFNRTLDSALRHLNRWMRGDRSEDHLAAAAWNVFAMLHFEETGQAEEWNNYPCYKRAYPDLADKASAPVDASPLISDAPIFDSPGVSVLAGDAISADHIICHGVTADEISTARIGDSATAGQALCKQIANGQAVKCADCVGCPAKPEDGAGCGTHFFPKATHEMQRDYLIFAVDFDGCLCESKWPEIGAPHTWLIERLKRRVEKGDKLILWTCREGERLREAVEWCKAHGLEFDAVNANLPEMNALYGNDSRKIGADYYIDDKAVRAVFGEAE